MAHSEPPPFTVAAPADTMARAVVFGDAHVTVDLSEPQYMSAPPFGVLSRPHISAELLAGPASTRAGNTVP